LSMVFAPGGIARFNASTAHNRNWVGRNFAMGFGVRENSIKFVLASILGVEVKLALYKFTSHPAKEDEP